MASYNGFTENIEHTKIDNDKILRDLEELETTLKYLKSYPPEELSDEVKSKIHATVTSFEVLQSRIFKSDCNSKIPDRLWDGQAMKYLFGNCIHYLDGIDFLRCSVCQIRFVATREKLKHHIESSDHINMYSEIIQRYSTCSVKAFDIDVGEKEQIIGFKGPNDMVYCKVCCKTVPNEKLLEHFKESSHQKSFEEIVNFISRSTKINMKPTLNDNLSKDKILDVEEKKIEKWLSDTVFSLIVQLLETELFCNRLYICTLCLFHTDLRYEWEGHCIHHNIDAHSGRAIIHVECACDIWDRCSSKVRSTVIICNYSSIVGFHHDTYHEALLKAYEHLGVRSHNEYSSNNVNNTNRVNINADLRRKQRDESTQWDGPLRLSGIREGTTDETLIREFEYFGNVEKIQRLSSATAILFIDLSSQYQKVLGLRSVTVVRVYVNGAFVEISKPVHSPPVHSPLDNSPPVHSPPVYSPPVHSPPVHSPPVHSSPIPSPPVHSPTVGRNENLIPKAIKRAFADTMILSSLIVTLVSKANDVAIYNKLDERRIAIRSVIEIISGEIRKLPCDVKAIGSRSLKLAISRDATLDLFVDFGDHNYQGVYLTITPQILRSRSGKIFGDLKKKNLSTIKNLEVVVLKDQPQFIQFQYEYMGTVKCRLFFGDRLDVEKTKLSRIYLNCDEKIYQMVLVLIEWFNVVGLKDVLPSYSILWLALFSLMVGPSPILHPVIVIKREYQGNNNIAGWDCGFSETSSPLITSVSTVCAMLLRFFQFYSNQFNFVDHVLAPFTGQQLLRRRFSDEELIDSYDDLHKFTLKGCPFKLTEGLCLQDPLEHNCNLTSKLQGDKLKKFLSCCQESLENFRQ